MVTLACSFLTVDVQLRSIFPTLIPLFHAPKRAQSVSDDEDHTVHPPKKPRKDLRTFKDRDGKIQATYTWPEATDNIIALRTPALPDSDVPEAVFLASRAVLCRDSEVFRDMLSLPQTDSSTLTQDTYEEYPMITL